MRSKRSILNFITSYSFYIIIGLLEFIKIRIFMNNYGENLMALNQLYINLFSYLNIVEAGLGAGLVYRLYRFLVDKEYEKINKLISGMQSIFRRIGIIIFILGFIVSFVIPLIIKNNMFSREYLNITFMLFTAKNIVDYFLFIPRYVIQADQQMYRINALYYTIRVIEVSIEIFMIHLGINYVIILMPGIFIRLFQNLIVNKRIRSIYPWLSTTGEKDMTVKRDINALFTHRFADLIFNNIDIVLLSTFVGAAAVTSYSVYNFIVKYAQDTINYIFDSIKDGLGNILNTENSDKIRSSMDEIVTIFSFLAVLLVAFFYFTLSEFVKAWIGWQYTVNTITLVLFLVTIYNGITIKTSYIFRNTMGLYRESKRMALVEAIINFSISILLVGKLKIAGVLLGTVAARMVTNMWYLPYLIHKKLFGRFIPKQQIFHLKNVFIIIVAIVILTPVKSFFLLHFPVNGLWAWLFYAVLIGIAVLSFVALFFLLFFKPFKPIIKKVFRSMGSVTKQLIKRSASD